MLGLVDDALSSSGLLRDMDGPVFREPWETQAFTMMVTRHGRELFTRSDWARALAAEIQTAQDVGDDDDDDGGTTDHHWLAALETIIADTCIATRETVERRTDA